MKLENPEKTVHTIDLRLPMLGRIRLAATADGLCALAFRDWNDDLLLTLWLAAGWKQKRGATAILDQAEAELRRYAAGDTAAFTVAIDCGPTQGFTRRAWHALRRVPFGQVVSYAELADRAGSPRAMRAAGQAMRRNRLPIVVPCHRVIGSGSTLGGFTPGIALKQLLLAHEGIAIPSHR